MIDVESDMTKGLPALQIVGLGNKAIDEARERVRSAITNSLLEYPAQRITINLAPADCPCPPHQQRPAPARASGWGGLCW